MTKIFLLEGKFKLGSGEEIRNLTLNYSTFGHLNEQKDNIVWVFHALTSNSNPTEWWSGLIGNDRFINPQQHFIICVNIPGSPYGSSSPLSIQPENEKAYYYDFPVFTIKDVVKAFKKLKDELNIQKIKIGIGGSTGGMHLLQWATEEPDLFETIIPIATNATISPWAIAFNATQRMAIETDATWGVANKTAGSKGLATARAIALLSYRNYSTYQLHQPKSKQTIPIHATVQFAADSYQRYQGIKIQKRFNSICYYRLTQMMDSHNVSSEHLSIPQALNKINSRTIVIGVDSDVLFPVSESIFIATHIPNACMYNITSEYGHDGFLLEYDQIIKILKQENLFKNEYS